MNKLTEKEDLEYSRETYLELIAQNREAVELAMQLARDTESPSVFRVLGELLKSTSDVTDRLIELHKSNKSLQEIPKTKELEHQGTTNNNVFIGSTEELQKLLQGKKEEKVVNDLSSSDNQEKDNE